jgi:hypothetical protein
MDIETVPVPVPETTYEKLLVSVNESTVFWFPGAAPSGLGSSHDVSTLL